MFRRGDRIIHKGSGYEGQISDPYPNYGAVPNYGEECYIVTFYNGYKQVCRASELTDVSYRDAQKCQAPEPASKQVTKLEDKKDKKNMSIIEKFALSLKSEPEKTYRKTGITASNDVITDEGSKIFLTWLLKKHGTEFLAEVATPLLKEIEDDK